MRVTQVSGYNRAEDILGVLIRRVSGLWRRTLNAQLSQIDLTEMQFVLLLGIAWKSQDGDTFTQSELAQHTKISRALASQVLRSLVRKRFILKSTSSDTRTWRLRLTARGEKKVEQAFTILRRTEEEFWGNIPDLAGSLRTALQAVLTHHAHALEGFVDVRTLGATRSVRARTANRSR
jgi:DNA-binding MarR family transcriptional regulator